MIKAEKSGEKAGKSGKSRKKQEKSRIFSPYCRTDGPPGELWPPPPPYKCSPAALSKFLNHPFLHNAFSIL